MVKLTYLVVVFIVVKMADMGIVSNVVKMTHLVVMIRDKKTDLMAVVIGCDHSGEKDGFSS